MCSMRVSTCSMPVSMRCSAAETAAETMAAICSASSGVMEAVLLLSDSISLPLWGVNASECPLAFLQGPPAS